MARGDMAIALAVAQVRYWLTVAPRVRAELRRWYGQAESISDPTLRTHAADKLRQERGNTEVIATLCTLAPRRHRGTLVVASVALQVMYDYLDAVTEQDVDEPLRNGRQLFRSFAVALTPGEAPVDYYQFHPQADDGGYLDALVASARGAMVELPAFSAVLPTVRAATKRFTEAQTRSHAVSRYGFGQLERWAEAPADRIGMAWWEWAGGAAASILVVHALLSAAADGRTTPCEALRIDIAYLLGSTLTTMLDSLLDDERDVAEDSHRFFAYYPNACVARTRLTCIARRAVGAARDLPHAPHHAMTVSGIAAFYLSLPNAASGKPRIAAAGVTAELKPTIIPILLVFRLWRRVRRS